MKALTSSKRSRGDQVDGLSSRPGAAGGPEQYATETCESKPGSVHALLGEIGSGKASMIKVISGSVQPNAGGLVLDGQPVDLRSPSQINGEWDWRRLSGTFALSASDCGQKHRAQRVWRSAPWHL